MNLGKLLSAGKSVFGGGKNKSYHENKRVYLPKFNAEKNPFTPNTAKPAAPEPSAESVALVAKTNKISEPIPARVLVKTGGATASRAPVEPVPVRQPVRAANWAEKLNPFRAAKPVAPSMVNAVQVELSLDTVKPIANDLADADIEVVPVKSSTVTPREPTLIPDSRESWEFAGVRVVKPV